MCFENFDSKLRRDEFIVYLQSNCDQLFVPTLDRKEDFTRLEGDHGSMIHFTIPTMNQERVGRYFCGFGCASEMFYSRFVKLGMLEIPDDHSFNPIEAQGVGIGSFAEFKATIKVPVGFPTEMGPTEFFLIILGGGQVNITDEIQMRFDRDGNIVVSYSYPIDAMEQSGKNYSLSIHFPNTDGPGMLINEYHA